MNHLTKILLSILLTTSIASAQQSPAELLVGRSLHESVDQLSAQLKANQNDQATRFALGVAQSLRAIEKAAGKFHEHGLMDTPVTRNLPIFRLPVPPNPDPKPTSAKDVDAILDALSTDLMTAAATLSEVTDPAAKLPLRVGQIRVDLNGDAPGGEIDGWQLVAELGGVRGDPGFQAAAEKFQIDLDLGDAVWLRGYCHLIAAFADCASAYDKSELIARVGHLFFAKPDSPYEFLRDGRNIWVIQEGLDAADIIAFIHLLNFPLRDAAKMKSAREHMLATLDCSEESWKAILAETDNSNEWIPNPNQQTVLPGVVVNQQIVDAWLAFLADGRDVLEGRKLVPFWRGEGGKGVNVKRVFDDAKPFDLVLWVQGTGAAPYLEDGPLSDADSLRQLQRLLGGDVFFFALWVN